MFNLLLDCGILTFFKTRIIIMNEHTNQMKEPAKGMAIASMVCGICSLVFIWVPFVNIILAIVGVAIGHVHLSNMKKSPEDFDGRGMAIAGLATGYVTIGFFILGLIMIMAGSAAFLSAL